MTDPDQLPSLPYMTLNGLSIEQWKARADALEAALRRWLPATRPYLFDASEQDQWKADCALLENKHGST